MKDYLIKNNLSEHAIPTARWEEALDVAKSFNAGFRAHFVTKLSDLTPSLDFSHCDALTVGPVFGCPQEMFDKVGGYDESYETVKWKVLDLAVRLERAGLKWMTTRGAAVLLEGPLPDEVSPDDEKRFNALVRDSERFLPVYDAAKSIGEGWTDEEIAGEITSWPSSTPTSDSQGDPASDPVPAPTPTNDIDTDRMGVTLRRPAAPRGSGKLKK
jgi:hypothetical protein